MSQPNSDDAPFDPALDQLQALLEAFGMSDLVFTPAVSPAERKFDLDYLKHISASPN